MTRLLRSAVLVLAWLAPASAHAAAAQKAAPISPDTLYARKDWPRAAEAYAAVTKAQPSNGRAWYRLGVSLGQTGHQDRAIPAYRRATALGFAPTYSYYNLACAYALTGDASHAFEALDSLMARGYKQPQALEADDDLRSLRPDPRFAAVVARARSNAFPCENDRRSREFDFWIGEWDVQDRNSGTPVGTSSVQLILGSCVIFENWTDVYGASGKSLNSFNRHEGWWQQNWVDDSGETTDFTHGVIAGNAMVYQCTGKAPDGSAYQRRLSFFNLGPDLVRQFSERSNDGGQSWSTEYDFNYLRKK